MDHARTDFNFDALRVRREQTDPFFEDRLVLVWGSLVAIRFHKSLDDVIELLDGIVGGDVHDKSIPSALTSRWPLWLRLSRLNGRGLLLSRPALGAEVRIIF